MIEVVGEHLYGQVVVLHHVARVGEHEVAVRLEVNQSVIYKETAVPLHEVGAGQPLGGLLHLGVGEGEPDFTHLAWGEEAVDNLDVGAQEGHVGHACFSRLLGPAPHARPLDIHPDEVFSGKETSQPHSVFPASAAQLQHDGVVVLEEAFVPCSPHLKRYIVHHREGVFKHMWECRHIRKFCQFSFTHWFVMIFVILIP